MAEKAKPKLGWFSVGRDVFYTAHFTHCSTMATAAKVARDKNRDEARLLNADEELTP